MQKHEGKSNIAVFQITLQLYHSAQQAIKYTKK